MFDIVTIFLSSFILLLGLYFWERSRRVTHSMAGGVHEDITLPHEEEWELYHNSFSIFSKKTRVCLTELGIKYKSHHIDIVTTGKFGNVSRDYLKINPAAVVPVLVHKGHPVYESHEQLAYASTHSGHSDINLVPQDEDKRKLMNYWVSQSSMVSDDPINLIEKGPGNCIVGLSIPFFGVLSQYIKIHHLLEGLLFHRIKERPFFFLVMKILGPQRILSIKYIRSTFEKGMNAMDTHLDRLEEVLSQSSGPWIVGNQFTLADVGMMTILDHLNDIDSLGLFLTNSRPHILSYWQALQQRPSYEAGIKAFCHPNIIRARERINQLKNSNQNFRNILVGKRELRNVN